MSFLNDFPQIRIVQELARQKNTAVYLVGGFLRDHLLNRPCQDFDFAVDKNAVVFARLFAKKIHGAFILLDAEHGCARVAKKEKGHILTFDFADFRAATIKKDLLHRDFTVNVFCLNICELDENTSLAKAIRDDKKAQTDLRAKRIRMVSTKAFKEDPLRLLRAFSLEAMLNFKIEPATFRQIKKDKDLIRNVSYERIREELFKILSSDRAAQTLQKMDGIGFLEKIIPQIAVMFRVQQGGYHHLDVWKHTLETVKQLEQVFAEMKDWPEIVDYLNETIAGGHKRYALMKLGAILHDIGKPQTKKKEEGRMSFHGHEIVGRGISRHVTKLLKLSVRERHLLEDMVFWHLRPGYLSNFKQPSEKSIYRYFRDTKEEAVNVLLFSLADQRSTRGPLTTAEDQRHHEKICLGLVKRYFEQKKETPLVRLINGNDLIKVLKLNPSPVFGKILGAVEEAQAMGKITTKDQALLLAADMVKKN